MKKFQHNDYFIIITGSDRAPCLTIYRNARIIVQYCEKLGCEIISGTCDEISTAMKLIPEYFPNKVVDLH